MHPDYFILCPKGEQSWLWTVGILTHRKNAQYPLSCTKAVNERCWNGSCHFASDQGNRYNVREIKSSQRQWIPFQSLTTREWQRPFRGPDPCEGLSILRGFTANAVLCPTSWGCVGSTNEWLHLFIYFDAAYTAGGGAPSNTQKPEAFN